MIRISNKIGGLKMIILFYLTVFFFQLNVDAQNNSFVYMQDNKFYLNCDELYPVIVNYSVIPIQNTQYEFHASPTVDLCHPSGCEPFWRSCGPNAAEWEAELIEHFTKMEELEFDMIRLFGFNLHYNPDFNQTEGEVLLSESSLQQLSPSSPECYSKQDPTIMTENTYSFQGDMLQKVIDVIKANDFDLKLIVLMGGRGVEMLSDNYKEYLGYMANRFKNEPVIFGYDLYNEPAWYSIEDLNKYESAAKFFSWYDTIKSVAPSQFVTIGVNVENAFRWDPEVLPLDFISLHLYPPRYESEQFNLQQYLERCKVYLQWYSESYTKPYIIGETGRPGVDGLPPNPPTYPGIGTEQEQAEFAEVTLKYSKWYGHIGYSWWKYKDTKWFEPDNSLATENYFGIVKIEPSILEDDEVHKPAGEMFINYDPDVDCDSCSHPDESFYHSPNSIYHSNELLYGNVSDGSGNNLNNVLVQALIKHTSEDQFEFSKAITNVEGNFAIYTSMNPVDVYIEHMVYSYPNGEYEYMESGFISPLNLEIEPLNQSLLPTIPNYNNWIISEGDDITWENPKVPGKNNIEVESGATLTIKSLVYFNEESRLIVKPGGKLIVDENGVLTSNCDAPWKGIEVWGNAGQGQSYTYQGAVQVINGGTIENALCAIQTIGFIDPQDGNAEIPNYTLTGGMINTDDANFINNRIAIKFWKYNYADSYSFIKYTNFITNDEMLPGTDPETYIIINGIDGVDVYASNFTDEHTVTLPDELISGIETFNATFKVTSYAGTPSYFNNLYDGIRALVRDPLKYPIITNNQFTENLRAMYLSSISGAVVTGNEFDPWEDEVLENEVSYCMYLDYCTDFTVEENTFIFYDDGETTPPTGIGLVINNSGQNNNEIYNNTFTNLEYATLAQGNNKGYFDEIGLKILCNDYNENSQDIAVTAGDIDLAGIARNQGAPGETDMQAGNRFSLNSAGSQESDYSSFKEAPITYFHHDPDLSDEPRVEPVYYAEKFISLDNQFTSFSKQLSCPPQTSGGGPGGGTERDGLKSTMEASEYSADSTQAILTTFVDGGNTQVLEQEVLLSMPLETYDLYMSLMGKSPYLSDSVLIAAIEKEDVLPNVLIKDILVANPQSAKSPEVMDKVDEKSNQMTPEMVAEVLLGKYFVAAKERLESQVAFYKHQRSTALKFLKQSYRNDTVNPWANDSLVALLESEQGLKEKFELVFAFAEQNNWTGALNLMNELSTQSTFNTYEQEIFDDFNQLIDVLYELNQSGSSLEDLTETQKTILEQLADNTQNIAGASARNILIKADNYLYQEPIILPEEGLKSGSFIFDIPNLEQYTPEYVKLYPNPAKEYIVVELLTGNVNGATLTVFDNQGKQKDNADIPGEQQFFVLQLKDLQTGIYYLKVKLDGKLLECKKFNVIK